jgi:biotin operon repressor
MSKKERILQYLQANANGISQKECTEEIGSTRLAPRILELKRSGVQIETIEERRGGEHWARYRLAHGTQLSFL